MKLTSYQEKSNICHLNYIFPVVSLYLCYLPFIQRTSKNKGSKSIISPHFNFNMKSIRVASDMNHMIRSDLLYGTNKLNADGCSKGNPGETMAVYSERKRCVVMLLLWQSCARSVGTSLTVILEKRTENAEIKADS